MAKVTINGEVFDWDHTRKPMSEALAVEHALKMPYAEYEQGLTQGSARALAGFVWLVWRRDGRDVKLADILSGEIEIDLAALDIEADEGEADPTSLTPEATNTTGADTSVSSPNISTSGPGKRASSPRVSSRS